MREHVLLTVDPEIGEAFLCRVENLGQVAQTAFLVEHFVGLAELLSVVASSAIGLEDFAEALDLIQEALAGALSILRVQVVLLVRPLLQVVAHHHRVFEEQKVGTAPELLDLGQRPRWRSLSPDGNQFRELKVVLADVVRVLSIIAGLPSRKGHEEG